GSTCGSQKETRSFSTSVFRISFGVPPLADTLHNPALKSGAKTIVLSGPQSPPQNPVPVSLQIVMGDPPLTATFFNSVAAPKAIHSLSGEKKGVLDPVAPSISFPSRSPSD